MVLALDTSGSMAGTRLAEAQAAAVDYAKALPAGVELGLVKFGDAPTTLLAPSTGPRPSSRPRSTV